MSSRKKSPAVDDEVQRRALAEVRLVYAELERRPHERSCTGRADCCHFHRTGRTPYLTLGEAMLAARAWRAAGRVALPPQAADGACPFLSGGRCGIYKDRPFGCRTHFCEAAGGPLARGDVRDLIQRLEAVDALLGGRGGVNLPSTVAAVMAVKRKAR